MLEEIMKKTSTMLLPTTSTHVPHATSFPTVVPSRPHTEHATAAGYRTLW